MLSHVSLQSQEITEYINNKTWHLSYTIKKLYTTSSVKISNPLHKYITTFMKSQQQSYFYYYYFTTTVYFLHVIDIPPSPRHPLQSSTSDFANGQIINHTLLQSLYVQPLPPPGWSDFRKTFFTLSMLCQTVVGPPFHHFTFLYCF